ncbi:ArsR/SmtB family transcription factor [Paractinoplanes toevensis]|uniref:HTH arsR-type domain-containing protein n=1 Tax=Paractinoplanes toevensis TaxID=571911 RepID=A0A919TFE2_9ACTN|nr:winged helix-turn-helix domain-containing protein [Actinoplanes toevensis]GIM93119.1 hypothetical protein Ato02nite_049120 [Actinoplanes toevensis]
MNETIDDALWSAIGDPTRRLMLDLLLADGGGTATRLSEHLPVTRQAVAKHLSVLDRAGLVHAAPTGRERRYEVDEAQLGLGKNFGALASLSANARRPRRAGPSGGFAGVGGQHLVARYQALVAEGRHQA